MFENNREIADKGYVRQAIIAALAYRLVVGVYPFMEYPCVLQCEYRSENLNPKLSAAGARKNKSIGNFMKARMNKLDVGGENLR